MTNDEIKERDKVRETKISGKRISDNKKEKEGDKRRKG